VISREFLMNRFQRAVRDRQDFCVSWELVPGRGACEASQQTVIDNARQAARAGVIHGIAVTDNPGGGPALAVECICSELRRSDIEPVVHFACRDRNRNGIESALYGLARNGVSNLLVVSGDYPSADGFCGTARPVFDCDPVHVLQLVRRMNQGHAYTSMGKTHRIAPTEFFAGVAVSPFKRTEAELLGQYLKLHKKIAAGADFIVTQIGYDMRKLHELMQWMHEQGYAVPVMANIYVLTCPAAQAMHAGKIPGCVVTDRLVRQLEQERAAADKGREARLLRAAKMYAIARELGCAGAHIGGHGLTCAMVEQIIARGEELRASWENLLAEFDYPQEGGFYYFERRQGGILNAPEQAPRTQKPSFSPAYLFSRLVHALLFEPSSPFFSIGRTLAAWIDRVPVLAGALCCVEDCIKGVLFGCKSCGDCALADVAYLCPVSRCPKNQRNGPCGGSRDGWCEVYPGQQKCLWVRAYLRLKGHTPEQAMLRAVVPPCDWQLWQTSSWLNFFRGRDHCSQATHFTGDDPPA
jgi:methylenetetrahydrofolate reductase (NADPH)